MKNTLVSALTGALVIGATATTFAAANPFEDVPAAKVVAVAPITKAPVRADTRVFFIETPP